MLKKNKNKKKIIKKKIKKNKNKKKIKIKKNKNKKKIIKKKIIFFIIHSNLLDSN